MISSENIHEFSDLEIGNMSYIEYKWKHELYASYLDQKQRWTVLPCKFIEYSVNYNILIQTASSAHTIWFYYYYFYRSD